MPHPKIRFHPKPRGNYIGGKFEFPTDVNGEWISRSPADATDELGRFSYSYAGIDSAIERAREAFPAWRRVPLAERAELLKKYQAALRAREDELVEVLAREVGKPLWESKTEHQTMLNKVDITLGESAKLVADYEIDKIMENTTGVCRYRPLGVLAVIGPFNFPGHLPNGHIVPALMTGNTVVFKPSEKAPMVGQLMAECFDEAGFPPGVFNLVQGERETGRRLCVHAGVDAVLFTGSYEVGTRIKQDTLQQHWKLLALEMGGKNPAIVWGDANLDAAVHETLVGAFLSCGQRCSATSRILVERRVAQAFTQKFHDRAKAFSIGHPLDNPFMGPLIDAGSVERYMKFLGIASREGFELVMRGKALSPGFNGNYVAPSIGYLAEPSLEASRKSVYQQTELFAPGVAILPVESVEDAIAQANVTQFGLVASVFCQDRGTFEKFREELQFGLINWNKSTVGASSRLPFGGLKKSGNHFPTALSAPLYCTTPVAGLEAAEAQVPAKPFPGLNWG
jgi:succinylglutamic semialdehyde dehydrogenase